MEGAGRKRGSEATNGTAEPAEKKHASVPGAANGSDGSLEKGAASPSEKEVKTPVKARPQPGAKRTRRVLVTGGAGFVGSHVCEHLVNRGDDVICLDNFFTGAKDNIKHLLGRPNFEVIRHDVVEPILLEVDQIYHLACPASPIHYKYNPVKTIKTSVLGTLNMLGMAKRVRARFLLSMFA